MFDPNGLPLLDLFFSTCPSEPGAGTVRLVAGLMLSCLLSWDSGLSDVKGARNVVWDILIDVSGVMGGTQGAGGLHKDQMAALCKPQARKVMT